MAILVSLPFQIFLGLGTLLIVSPSHTDPTWAITMAAYWAGVAVIVFRRPIDPTRLDVFFIRWSFPVIYYLAAAFIVMIGKL